ncbi:MAG: hypothetical protein IPK57_14480 [Chitinophagaceae bacterium]|nr:hypothetical protein [Chitinophagaceae bacterium]
MRKKRKTENTVKLDSRIEDYVFLSSVTIANDGIFIGGKYLNAFDKEGNLKWQMATTDDIY